MTKLIVISGGVVSGLGKGITSSSLGLLLKTRGYTVTAIKIDPYLNIDSGTMSPFEHGECYVLDDGSETDLDLGNYERFLEVNLYKDNSITSGQIYKSVIDNERSGKYLGKTVQMVPHISNEIINRIEIILKQRFDFCIIELGGTVGDIESNIFLEALRQIKNKYHTCHIHVSLIPLIGTEDKTKPTQASLRTLMSNGIIPQFLVVRCHKVLNSSCLNKLIMFSNLSELHIIQNYDVSNIYKVPIIFKNQLFDIQVLKYFNLDYTKIDYDLYQMYQYMAKHNNNTKVNVGIVGKYIGSNDTYLSIIRALDHACYNTDYTPNIVYVENIDNIDTMDIKCFIIPGGFGYRGCQLKLKAINYAYHNNIPILGICLGFQLMAIYLAKELLKIDGVTHQEWGENIEDPKYIIKKMEYITKLETRKGLGGTMRLGGHEITINRNTNAYEIYNTDRIIERHRHRYGINDDYLNEFEDNGVIFSGVSKECEILEINNHKFFMGCQFHPEFTSRLTKPHPLFKSLWYKSI